MFDWVQMLTATLQPNQAETRFLPPQNCTFLLVRFFYYYISLTSSNVSCTALKIILPSPQPGLYSIPGSNCIRTKTCEIQNCIITDKPQIKGPLQAPLQFLLRKQIILGLWGEDWSHWEGLWSHISCPVRLVPHCCLGTCKENIQITVEHIFKLLRFFLIPNYLNNF